MKDNVKYCPHNTGGNQSEKQATIASIRGCKSLLGNVKKMDLKREKYAYTRRRCLP